MKRLISYFLLFVIAALFYSFLLDDKNTYTDDPVLDAKLLTGNTIGAWYRNNGSFNRNPSTGNSGFEWPLNQSKYARYASGLWFGTVAGGDTLIAMAEYDYEFLPGYTDNSGNPQGNTDPAYRVYKLTAGVNDQDRMQWPNALLGNSDQGAPVYFDLGSSSWKPLDFGTQTMYFVYTDSYQSAHGNNGGSTAPIKLDVKTTAWSINYPGALENTQFIFYRIINRRNVQLTNLYIGIWSDDDLGDAVDDMVACDTNLQLGYTYNADNNDAVYGAAPPAVGFSLIRGPFTYTGNPNDTAYFCFGQNRIVKVGYKNLSMNIFNWYTNGGQIYGDPQAYNQTYRMLNGLNKLGQQIINPQTNLPTKFFYSGDPVTGQGWVSGPMTPDDQRFLMSVGPVTMQPNDTQYIVTAQIIGRGTSNLNSITVLKQYTAQVRDYYVNCFEGIPIGIKPVTNTIPGSFALHQNYPNPFNPVTTINFDVAEKGFTKLEIVDITGRTVTTIVDSELQPGSYSVNYDASELSSGIYFYRIVNGSYTETRKMVLMK
jgi:hypothetical protein